MSNYFNIFDYFGSILISYRLKLIGFELFDINWTRFNQFRHDNLTSGFKFGSKMLIRRRFDHDMSRFGDLDWLDHLSLSLMRKTAQFSVSRAHVRLCSKLYSLKRSNLALDQFFREINFDFWTRRKPNHQYNHTSFHILILIPFFFCERV